MKNSNELYSIKEFRNPWKITILKLCSAIVSGLIALSTSLLGLFLAFPLKTILWIAGLVLWIMLLYEQYQCVKELNILCQEYETDADNISPNYLVVLLLSALTFSIYQFYWYYKQGNRIQFICGKAGTKAKDSGSKYLILALLSPLTFGITSLVIWYSLFKSRNNLADKYFTKKHKPVEDKVEVQSEQKKKQIPKQNNNKTAESSKIVKENGTLTGLTGEYKTARIPIEHGSGLVIGRDSKEANLVIKKQKISRRHCTISYNADAKEYIIVDYSSNGTYFMDGSRLCPLENVRVPKGTEIYIGTKENCFRLE